MKSESESETETETETEREQGGRGVQQAFLGIPSAKTFPGTARQRTIPSVPANSVSISLLGLALGFIRRRIHGNGAREVEGTKPPPSPNAAFQAAPERSHTQRAGRLIQTSIRMPS